MSRNPYEPPRDLDSRETVPPEFQWGKAFVRWAIAAVVCLACLCLLELVFAPIFFSIPSAVRDVIGAILWVVLGGFLVSFLASLFSGLAWMAEYNRDKL